MQCVFFDNLICEFLALELELLELNTNVNMLINTTLCAMKILLLTIRYSSRL